MTFPARQTVLILGANGRFGLAAAKAFGAAGWNVLAHVRRAGAPGMPPRARLVRAPLAGVAEALAGSARPDVIVHALNPIYTRWNEEAMPLALAGMDLAEHLGARFMLPGNVYNYGAGMPALIDEQTPRRPTTEKGRLRAEMEKELEHRAAAGRLRSTVITAGDFFGEGSGSWLDQVVVKSIARGKLAYPGVLEIVHAWAYLPDLARAFVAVAAAPGEAPFERFMFAGHALTGRQFIAATERAAASLGLAPAGGWRYGTMPWGVLHVLGLVMPLWRELARMSYLWRVPHALDGARLAARCPGLQTTPIDEALSRSLAALAPERLLRRPSVPAAPDRHAGASGGSGTDGR